jgi:hypothetical protein
MTLVSWDVLNLPGYKNPLALTLVLWLYYQSSSTASALLSLLDEVIEIEEFIRCDPSFWEEVELIWECFLHQFKILG